MYKTCNQTNDSQLAKLMKMSQMIEDDLDCTGIICYDCPFYARDTALTYCCTVEMIKNRLDDIRYQEAIR